MEHREIRRELADRMRMLLKASDPEPKQFRPYQTEAVAKTVDWLEDPGGTRRGHIVHATGLGKTLLFSRKVKYMGDLRALVIAPSKVLIEQTARAMTKITGGVVGHLSSLGTITDLDGTVIATRGHQDHSIVITTDATLKAHGNQIATGYNPHLILRDECHWSYSPKSQEALAHTLLERPSL